MFKKVFLFFSLLISLLLATTVSVATSKPSFNKVVFFGDSLTDNGNLYRHTDHLIPSYLPYYRGRFTDGYTWADRFSYSLYSKYNIRSINYAVGGATTILHNPMNGYLPVTAEMELADYELGNALKNKDNTLYAIWFGANDYLNGLKGSETVDKVTTAVVNEISTLVDKLVAHKNAEFLIIGLPNLSYTPDASAHNMKDIYQQLSSMHNQKLHQAIVKLRKKFPNTKIFEFSFIDHPLLQNMVESKKYRDQLNKKYGTNVINVTNPCIPVDYHKKPSFENIQTELSVKQNAHQLRSFDSRQLANEIMNSPALTEAYRAEQAYDKKQSICAYPSQHLFWDYIHPTTVIHKILATMMLDKILK